MKKIWHKLRIFMIKKYLYGCLDDNLHQRLLNKLEKHSKALERP